MESNDERVSQIETRVGKLETSLNKLAEVMQNWYHNLLGQTVLTRQTIVFHARLVAQTMKIVVQRDKAIDLYYSVVRERLMAVEALVTEYRRTPQLV